MLFGIRVVLRYLFLRYTELTIASSMQTDKLFSYFSSTEISNGHTDVVNYFDFTEI